MRSTCGDSDLPSNFAGDQSVLMVGPIGPRKPIYAANEWFMLLADALWKPKAPAAVCDLAELDEDEDRKCRKWTSGFNEPPGWLVVRLLRSPEGYRVLNYIMEPSPPTWWLVIQQERELAALAREIFSRIGAVVSHDENRPLVR
jgi:hypothetical protein